MRRKTRIMLALLLIITIGIQSFRLGGIIKVDGKDNNNKLEAGDWLYLNTKFSTGNWQDYGAKVYMWYQTKYKDSNGNYNIWQNIEMIKYDEDLLRVKIPDDMYEEANFMFRRFDPANVNFNSWQEGQPGLWNRCPLEKDGDIKLKECPENCNTYMLTDAKHGKWAGEGVWNGKSYAGEKIYFLNMDLDRTINKIYAVFTENGAYEIKQEMNLYDNKVLGLYVATIPNVGEYDTVIFKDNLGTELGRTELFTGDYNPKNANTYYYKRTVKEDGSVINSLDVFPKDRSISGKQLYFDNSDFPVGADEELRLKIGAGEEIHISAEEGKEIYSYTIPEDSDANQQTVITLSYKGNTYHFLWEDLDNDLVCIYKDVADVSDIYRDDESGDERLIYFDATLSKLSYRVNNAESYALPLDGDVRYHAWSDSNEIVDGQMQPVLPREISGNEYKDVYKAKVDSKYNHIVFYSGNAETNYDDIGTIPHTEEQEIPAADKYRRPCFYADTGDAYVYDNDITKRYKRGGYWNEVYNIRNAEEGKKPESGIAKPVVDIPVGEFKREKTAYYVSASLYDYYTDYELNGYNRDDYQSADNYSHRMFQPFRQFNQALSDYYKKVGAASPLYWGSFQNPQSGGADYNQIADTLNLFGYSKDTNADLHKKFFYENHSMWGRNNVKLYDENGQESAAHATLGLVSEKLTKDYNLMLKTANGETVEVPYFNDEFLQGRNSKNTVLAKIYQNVQFPFIKKEIGGLETIEGNSAEGSVNYWYFSSADRNAANKNLMLKQDKDSGMYYLEPQAEEVKGFVGGDTKDSNYFPFNAKGQSGDFGKLNYGFGQRMDLKFQLPGKGTVKTTKDEAVPIEFHFSGDDDVWVFIDGQLVLDVGGAHGIVDTTMDFAKRESYVSAIKNDDSVNGGRTTNVIQQFPSELMNDDFYNKEHTLTIFYMERGLWESNLYISFNFPDESRFAVEKEVDNIESVHELFREYFEDFSFSFNIKNQATHYGTYEPGTSGFSVTQQNIFDYRSVESGKLENAVGAEYYVSGSDNPEKVGDDGIFKLKNGESATFTDQFRHGSYIWLNELDMNEDNFKTKWELYDNGIKVTSTRVPPSHTNVKGGWDLDDNNTAGTLISDGRVEEYNSDITNTGYTEAGAAKIEGKDGVIGTTDDTIVYRKYNAPDTIIGINLKVKEINTVRTGDITVKKEQAADSADLGDELFTFKVTFTDVSGMDLEGETPIEESFQLEKGGSKTLSGIPAGTKYTVSEIAGDSSTLEKVEVSEGNDSEVVVNGYAASGIITADEDDSAPTVFTFVNSKNVGSITINKRDSEGELAGAEFTLYKEDGTIAKDEYGNSLTATTDNSGNILFGSIPVGTRDEPQKYYLKETKTVTGHSLIKEPIEVELPYKYRAGSIVNGKQADEDGITYSLTYTIINDRVFELPSSGQDGIEIYIMLGIVLTVTSGSVLIFRFRQKRKTQ